MITGRLLAYELQHFPCKHLDEEMETMRRESGLTLFELMVVIGIMAVMASIAVPGVIGWLPGYRMRSGADELRTTLQLAKMRAVRENAIVAVTFNFTNDSYVAFVDNSGDGIQNGIERTVKTGRMPQGIDLQDSGLGALVMFDRRGFPTTDGVNPLSGNVVVSNGSGTQTINLTLAGSASIQ
jgi:prepilin-type N-terminal cleavage/methylation domain-containing protein